MFTAMTKSNQTINIFSYNSEEVEKLKKEVFYCPICKEKLVLKKGNLKRPHFSHYKKSICINSGETTRHLLAKEHLYNYLGRKNIAVEVEKYIHANNQRADIYFKISKKEFVFEFQYSNLSFDSLLERWEGYKRINIIQIWLFDVSTVKKKREIYELRSYHVHYLNLNLNNQLFLYCPQTNTITILTSILFLHSTRIIASEMILPLPKLPLSTFFNKEKKKNGLYNKYFKMVRNEKEKLALYYQNNRHFIYLMYEAQMNWKNNHLIGIPLKTNRYFSTSSVIWQGYLYFFMTTITTFSKKYVIEYLVELIKNKYVKIFYMKEEILQLAVNEYISILHLLKCLSYNEIEDTYSITENRITIDKVISFLEKQDS